MRHINTLVISTTSRCRTPSPCPPMLSKRFTNIYKRKLHQLSTNIKNTKKFNKKLSIKSCILKTQNRYYPSHIFNKHKKTKDFNSNKFNFLLQQKKNYLVYPTLFHKKKNMIQNSYKNLLIPPIHTYYYSKRTTWSDETMDIDVDSGDVGTLSDDGDGLHSNSRYRRRGKAHTNFQPELAPNDITHNDLFDQKPDLQFEELNTARIVRRKPKFEGEDKSGKTGRKQDLFGSEIGTKTSDRDQQASIMFDLIWNKLVAEQGLENMVFPKEIMWLAGAPGSGKSVMTPFIMKTHGIETAPIQLGNILNTPEMLRLKNSGKLIGDREVVTTLLEMLLSPEYSGKNVLVDGFPRTPNQAHCIKLLFDKMLWLRRNFEDTKEVFSKFRRPVFHITVLYVEESISVQRQLKRGREVLDYNQRVDRSGVGEIIPLRATDIDARKAHERYRVWTEQLYGSLNIVKEKFPFHFINAEGTPKSVQQSIVKELQYQSNQELADATFDNVRQVPLATEIKKEARHNLVKRLDSYQTKNSELFSETISYIKSKWVPIIQKQALTGHVVIRTEDEIFFKQNHLGISMALDVLTERGYRIHLEYIKNKVPTKVDLETGEMIFEERQVYVFNIRWPPPKIRHSTDVIENQTDGWDTSIV